MNWIEFYRLLRPETRLNKKRFTIYKRYLKAIGIELVPVPPEIRSPRYQAMLCKFDNVKCECNGITFDEFIRHRHKFITGTVWRQRNGITVSEYKWLIRKRKIPFIRIGKRRLYVPADIKADDIFIEEVSKKAKELEEEIKRLAQGSVNAIVFPNWKKYKAAKVKKFILQKYAAERRLLRVDNTYGILFSLAGKTLDDLLKEEDNNIENLVYYIKHPPDAARFRRAKVKEIVSFTP